MGWWVELSLNEHGQETNKESKNERLTKDISRWQMGPSRSLHGAVLQKFTWRPGSTTDLVEQLQSSQTLPAGEDRGQQDSLSA